MLAQVGLIDTERKLRDAVQTGVLVDLRGRRLKHYPTEP
jgi:hypothetical protein